MSTSTATSASTSTSLTPSDVLANNAGNAFCLFNSDWLNLQNFVKSSLLMPLNTGDFKAKYGQFNDETQVDTCVTNLNTIAGLSTKMGDPTELQNKIAANPQYTAGTTPPAEIYAQSIWLASQISQAAQNFNSNFSNLNQLFTGTPEENTANVIDFLTGAGGMVSMAQTVLGYADTVQNNLSGFKTLFTPAAQAVNTYFAQSGNVLAEAQTQYNADATAITSLQSQAASAHKEWEDFTISAVTVSVGIMVLSCGLLWPLAAGAATGLGIEATKELNLYNSLMSQITTKEADEQQKNQLMIDLSGFNTSLAQVETYITGFTAQLKRIQGVWTNQIDSLTAAADYCKTHNFATYSEMNAKFNILDVQNSWQEMANLTSEFTTNCLVTYLTTVQYPQQIPTSLAPVVTNPNNN